MCFLYSAQVVAPIVRSVPRASAGLSRLAASPVPAAPPAPTSVCTSSMNRMIGFGLACTSSISWRRRCSNSPFIDAPAWSRPRSSESSDTPCSCGGTSPRASRCAKPSTTAVLPTPGLAGEDRVVLAAAHQDVDDLADLVVAAGHRVHLALLGLRGQVDRVLLDRLLLAHRRRRHRARDLARLAARQAAAVLRPLALLAGLADDGGEIVGEVVDLDLAELLGDAEQGIAQVRRLQHAEQQVGAAHRTVAELQRAVDPAALDRIGDVLGEVGERGRAARQPVERRGHVARHRRGVERVVADDRVDVGGVVLEQLRHPVDELDIRIAAQLAEHGRALDRLVDERVELAEQRHPTDFTHSSFLSSSDCVRHGAPIHAAAGDPPVRTQPDAFHVHDQLVRIGGAAKVPAALQPGGSAEAADAPVATAGQRPRRHVVALQDQPQVPGELEAHVLAHQRAQLLERLAVRQQRGETLPRQRPDDDAELVLHVPDRSCRAPRRARPPAGRRASAGCAPRDRAASSGPGTGRPAPDRRTAASATLPGRPHRAPTGRAGRRRRAWESRRGRRDCASRARSGRTARRCGERSARRRAGRARPPAASAPRPGRRTGRSDATACPGNARTCGRRCRAAVRGRIRSGGSARRRSARGSRTPVAPGAAERPPPSARRRRSARARKRATPPGRSGTAPRPAAWHRRGAACRERRTRSGASPGTGRTTTTPSRAARTGPRPAAARAASAFGSSTGAFTAPPSRRGAAPRSSRRLG